MELKIEDLKVGDELFDCDGVLHTVVRIDCWEERVYIDTEEMSCFVSFCDLNSFKKKEQSQYTFDDLIDVAVQAKKDGMIRNVFLGSEHIDFDYGDEEYAYTTRDITSGVNFIQSLYKETFVIETEEDLNRISGVVNSVVLSNGEEIINIIRFHKNKPCFAGSIDRVDIPFCVLKGATVTQSK